MKYKATSHKFEITKIGLEGPLIPVARPFAPPDLSPPGRFAVG